MGCLGFITVSGIAHYIPLILHVCYNMCYFSMVQSNSTFCPPIYPLNTEKYSTLQKLSTLKIPFMWTQDNIFISASARKDTLINHISHSGQCEFYILMAVNLKVSVLIKVEDDQPTCCQLD